MTLTTMKKTKQGNMTDRCMAIGSNLGKIVMESLSKVVASVLKQK